MKTKRKNKNGCYVKDGLGIIPFYHRNGDKIDYAVVDREDLFMCARRSWCFSYSKCKRYGKVATSIDRKMVTLGKFILNMYDIETCPDNDLLVYHHDNNPLNNRKENLYLSPKQGYFR